MKIKKKSGETLVETIVALLLFAITIGLVIQVSMTALRMTGSAARDELEFLEKMNAAVQDKSGVMPERGEIQITFSLNGEAVSDSADAPFFSSEDGFVSFK